MIEKRSDCIDDADRDRLLDAGKWPDSVIISQWYYKSPPSGVNLQRSAGRAAVPSSSAVVMTVPSVSTSTSAVLAATTVSQPSSVSSVTSAPSSSASTVVPPAATSEENIEFSSDTDNSLDGTLAYHDGTA